MTYIITVTEEQNEKWHRDNIRECWKHIRQVQAENNKRLDLAYKDLEEAKDWAREEGLKV